MGPTISVSHWLDFWVLIISSRFDFKAAIDTFPSLLLGKMLIGVFGSALAAAWVGSGLVANMFRAKAHRREGYCLVAFGTGQPLGFYGSWTLFTLAHHNTVWLSTELMDPSLLPMLSWVTIFFSEMRRWQLCTRRWWPFPTIQISKVRT